MSRHVRTLHEQRKDHACPQCDTAFGQASDLRTHIRTVHEQRRDHACPQCNAAFGVAGTLRTYVHTVHDFFSRHVCTCCVRITFCSRPARLHGHNVQTTDTSTYRMMVTLFSFFTLLSFCSNSRQPRLFTHMALGFGLHCYERNDHCVHCGPYLRLSPATCPEKLAAVPRPVVLKIVMGTSLYSCTGKWTTSQPWCGGTALGCDSCRRLWCWCVTATPGRGGS